MQMIRRQLFRNLICRNSFSQQVEGTSVSKQPAADVNDAPIHLRSYDAKKYEVPSSKLKISTGYSFLDVEPVPRAKIMKICYIVLEKMQDVPQKALYRLYTEEKMKYIMKLTDQMDDVKRLEEELGFETVELFIQSLHGEIHLADNMIREKPWEMKDEDHDVYELMRQIRRDPKLQPENLIDKKKKLKFINMNK